MGTSSIVNDTLAKLYFDPSNPVAFSGARNLIKNVAASGIDKNKVEHWLSKQETYTHHKQIVRKFKRNFYYASRDKELFQCDLCDMRSLSKANDGYAYLLTCIDVFSKFAYVRPLKSKSNKDVIKAFQSIFEVSKPKSLSSDKGSEFTGKPVREYLNSINVKYYVHQNPDVKAGVVERFNRTLKERMWRMFTYANSHRYIDDLQNLVSSYNNSFHRSIKMKPTEVNEDNLWQVWTNLYGNKDISDSKNPAFKVGDFVLITKEKGTFTKGYEPGWRREIFQINRVIKRSPVVYEIKDLDGEVITGTFYGKELQRVRPDLNQEFKIEKIIKTRGKGINKEVLVKYLGYPSKFNSWIKFSTMTRV